MHVLEGTLLGKWICEWLITSAAIVTEDVRGMVRLLTLTGGYQAQLVCLYTEVRSSPRNPCGGALTVVNPFQSLVALVHTESQKCHSVEERWLHSCGPRDLCLKGQRIWTIQTDRWELQQSGCLCWDHTAPLRHGVNF